MDEEMIDWKNVIQCGELSVAVTCFMHVFTCVAIIFLGVPHWLLFLPLLHLIEQPAFHFSILVISQTFKNLYFKVLYIICMALPKYHTYRWNGITHHRKAPFSFPRGSSQQNWLILHLVVTSSFFYGRTKVPLASLIYKNQGRKERERIGLLRFRNEE